MERAVILEGVKNEGPPDLELWLKKLFSKLKFQKGPRLKDILPPSEEKGGLSWWIILPCVLFVGILLSGIMTVQSGDQVVVMRLGVYQETLSQGTHWLVPLIDRHITLDVRDNKSISMAGIMSTQDQYVVNANVSLMYTVNDAKTYLFSSQNTPAVLQAYLRAASLKAFQTQTISNLLNHSEDQTLADKIKENLNLDPALYGIQVQGVSINSISVPEAMNASFVKTINAAQGEARALVNNAQNYKSMVLPLAIKKASELQQSANVQRAAIIVAAEANLAQFKALLPLYQKDAAASEAYLPLAVMVNVLSANQITMHHSPNGTMPTDNNQNAYLRWTSANQR